MSFSGRDDAFDATEIANNGFFPALSLGDFNAMYRIDPSYSKELVVEALTLAVMRINTQLVDRMAEWQAAGADALEEVPQSGLGTGEGIKKMFVHHYKRAVYAMAKSKLIKEYATLTRREKAENTARESKETEDYYLAESKQALRVLLGKLTKREVVLL